MRLQERGFTLLELLVALAVLIILLLVVIPNYGHFVAKNRVASLKDQLVSSIALARSEAVSRADRVVLCRKSAANETCAGTSTANGSKDWSTGWLLFVDEDGDSVVDAGELIKVFASVDEQSELFYSRGDQVIYDSTGMLATGAAGDETFAIGDKAYSIWGAGLLLRVTGQVRSCVDWDVGAKTCADS